MLTVKQRLELKAKAQGMDFVDFLYYEIKDLEQNYDFWNSRSYKQISGAKVRARNLLGKLRDAREVLQQHEAETNTVLVNFLYKS